MDRHIKNKINKLVLKKSNPFWECRSVELLIGCCIEYAEIDDFFCKRFTFYGYKNSIVILNMARLQQSIFRLMKLTVYNLTIC